MYRYSDQKPAIPASYLWFGQSSPTFDNWDNNEPNVGNDRTSQSINRCVKMHQRGTNLTWQAEMCDTNLKYVCQYRAPSKLYMFFYAIVSDQDRLNDAVAFIFKQSTVCPDSCV